MGDDEEGVWYLPFLDTDIVKDWEWDVPGLSHTLPHWQQCAAGRSNREWENHLSRIGNDASLQHATWHEGK